jgi:hypothetical protein
MPKKIPSPTLVVTFKTRLKYVSISWSLKPFWQHRRPSITKSKVVMSFGKLIIDNISVACADGPSMN